MSAGTAHGSLELLRQRIAAIPASLTVAAELPLPELDRRRPGHVVTTGIGASEGPARALATWLATSSSAHASFVPLSRFHVDPPAGDLLVLFSQGLSPNARLALAARDRFARVLLVTSVGYSGDEVDEGCSLVQQAVRRGVEVLTVPPHEERGMLVRVVGPCVAMLVAMRLADRLGARSLLGLDASLAARLYRTGIPGRVLPEEQVHVVVAGFHPDLALGHRSKLLEGCLLPPPSLTDVLDLAHGTVQALHDREATFVVLATATALPLVERLRSVVSPGRHSVVPFVSSRNDALAFFEHAAAVDACVVATLEARPRDLFDWPGRGLDGPLYDLGR